MRSKYGSIFSLSNVKKVGNGNVTRMINQWEENWMCLITPWHRISLPKASQLAIIRPNLNLKKRYFIIAGSYMPYCKSIIRKVSI